MATTRSAPPPMTIHQDVLGPFSQTPPSPSPTTTNNSAATALHVAASSRLSSASSTSNPLRPSSGNLQSIMFRPPIVGPSTSPFKRKQQQKPTSFPATVFRNSFDRISMPPPDQDAFVTDSLMKKPPVSVFDTSIPMPSHPRRPSTALFTQFQASKAMAEKENYEHLDGRLQKAGVRRVLMEAAPIKEMKVLKEKANNNATIAADLDKWEAPVIMDDGKKPPYSYATLIGMAILRASNRRLTLAQIYKWIGDSFQYYRSSNNGWQNSIRHNLSLNKAFVKQERPKDDPGKGNYWVIQKGCEQQFMKSKNSRKSGKNTSSASSSSSPPLSKKLVLSKATVKQEKPIPDIPEVEIHVDCSELPASTPSDHHGSAGAIGEAIGDGAVGELSALSSDATRSAGSISPEPPCRLLEDDDIFRPSSPQGVAPANSSPPPIMCSSPPLTRTQLNHALRDVTPPPLFPSSSLRKRKLSSMNDSGYFSSLESSVVRPNNADEKPRIKRGRAEEDIARIRHPQHESPTRRSTIAPACSSMLGTSSPLRNYDLNTMLPPLTPATTLRPQKPPRSVSPMTHLRRHRDRIRQLVKSPSRDVDILDDDPWGSTFAALAYHEFAMENCSANEIENIVTRNCFGSPERGVTEAGAVRFNSAEAFGEGGFFDTPDVYGVDVFGVMKSGFERFTNDCPESPTAGVGRLGLHKSHTTKF